MQNENVERIRTSLPYDNKKHIDYVIKYVKHTERENDAHEKERQAYRDYFIDQVQNQRLEVFKIEIENKQKKHNYILLHCPIERLLEEAETTKLEMQLKTEHLKNLKYESKVELPFITTLKSGFKSLNQRSFTDLENNVSTSFDMSIKTLFDGVDENNIDEKLFSTRTRSLLVDNILNSIDLSKVKKIIHKKHHKDDSDDELEEGIGFMLHEEHFEDAFILHDETDYKIELQRFLEKANLLFKDDDEIKLIKIESKSGSNNDQDKRLKNIREISDIRTELHKRWASLRNLFKFQPLNTVREYFGEEYALYFAWTGAIISTLWVPALIGIIFFIAGLSLSIRSNRNSNSTANSTISVVFAESFDNDLTPYYALIICLWGAFFLEYWKRLNASLAYDWNVLKFESDETELPEYVRRKAIVKQKLAKKSIYIKYAYQNEKQLKMFVSFLILLFMICIVALDVAAVVLYRIYIKLNVYPKNTSFQLFIGDLGSTVLNAIFTIFLNWMYDKIALVTTKWEYHRTRTQFNDNLIMKTFAFQFVNNYASLIYLAFFRNIELKNGIFNMGSEYQDKCTNNNCMALLTTQILVSLIIKPFPSFLTTVIIPIIHMTYKGIIFKRMAHKIGIKQSKNKLPNNQIEINKKHVGINLYIEKTKSDPNETLSDEFTNKIIILGYILLFACAFSLGPLIFLIINLFDLRVDAQRLLWVYRRPIGYRAQDIGSWYNICRFLNVIAIVVNGLVIAYTSNWSKKFLNDDSTNRLIFFVVFEHFVFIMWYLITFLISDIPSVTRARIRQEQNYVKEIIYESKKTDKNQEIDKLTTTNMNEMQSEATDNFITTDSSNKRPYDDLQFKSTSYSLDYSDDIDFSPRRKKNNKHMKLKASLMSLNSNESVKNPLHLNLKNSNKIESIDELEKKKKDKEKMLRSLILPVNNS